VSRLVALILGGGVGVGALLIAFGLMGRRVLPTPGFGPVRRGRPERLVLRLALSVAAGLGAYGLTHWPVGGILAALGAWVTPLVLSGRTDYQREIERVEAIAAWAEMLRDTIAAAAGLEQAIAATGPIAPSPIAAPVSRLAVRLELEPLTTALRQFADEVNHPTCDFVVAALVIAAEKEARDLGPLLGHLAECARDEAKMRTRIWIDRAKTRTSVKVIAASVVLFAVGLILFSRDYLDPYDGVGGQLTLLAIGALFAGSFVAMERMGRIAMPERFISRRFP
jgi:tight adherence protein B